MSFGFSREFKVKFEGTQDVVEAFGMETVKMAYKKMKAEKRKLKKNGYKPPRCVMSLTDDDMIIKNTRNNIPVYTCKIGNISYVMSSLFDKLYIAIIVTDRGENSYDSKCVLLKTQYGQSKHIVSEIRDILMRRHSRLLRTAKSDLPCKNCLKIFQENNVLKQRIEDLAILIDSDKLESYLKTNKIMDLKSVESEDNCKFKPRRTVTLGQQEMDLQNPRKISCPAPTNKEGNYQDPDMIPIDEIINWNNNDPWSHRF